MKFTTPPPELIPYTELKFETCCFGKDPDLGHDWQTFTMYGKDADGKTFSITVPASCVLRQVTIAVTGSE